MAKRFPSFSASRPSLSFLLLLLLLAALWIAGGASRASTYGQVVVRSAAWAAIIAGVLFARRPTFHDARPVAWLLGASILLLALQLVPLPPSLWQQLPGRTIFSDAATLSGQNQPWRPWTIVPGATMNALFSLAVPLAVLLLITSVRSTERVLLPGIMLALISASTLVGLVQFAGIGFTNPLVNDTPGQVSATFANRNHFALFVAFGCALAPVWPFVGGGRPNWRGAVALGLLPLFTLTILASGSRAGMVVGVIGLAAGLVIAWQPLRKELGRYPRWVLPVVILSVMATIALLVTVSIGADRAVSVSRMLTVEPSQDMRERGLPTVLKMIQTYFPVGTGFGTFDPMFRLHEPFNLLKLTYFNHVHNDYLEILLDGGLPGSVLLGVAIAWWFWASVRAWRKTDVLPKLGSTLLLLVLIASLFDYPARTPLVMASIVVAGVWLSGRAALPGRKQHL